MATLPRYENLGVQYAAVPKISTAPQEVMARGLDRLSSNIDRLTSYALTEREKQVKKEAAQYAVDNPITGEQLNAALQDPNALKVKGAGPVFQETYQAYAAAQLSADLQLQASTALKRIELQVENGQMDALEASVEMQDLLDGQTSFLRAVSPEYAVKHRAAVATMSATSRDKVYEFEQKRQVGFVKAELELQLQGFSKRVEDIILNNSGKIDVKTGEEVDVTKMVVNELTPYAMSVQRLNGDNTYYKKALEEIEKAKVSTLTGLMQDRTFAPDSVNALKRIQKGDYGKLTPIYNSLNQTDKDKLRSNILKGFADEQTLTEIDQKRVKAENKIKSNALNVELLRPNIPASRQREIVYTLVGMDEMTFEQADKHLNGEEGKGDVDLYLRLNDQISRNVLGSLGQLAMFKEQLSRAEYKSLGTALTSAQGSKALKMINLEAGIRENAFVSEDQKAKQKKLLEFYDEELAKENIDSTGVSVYAAPTDAAAAAIKRYTDSKEDEKREKAKNRARQVIENVFNTQSFKKRNIKLPDLPIQEIDFGSIKGITADEAARLRKDRDEALGLK